MIKTERLFLRRSGRTLISMRSWKATKQINSAVNQWRQKDERTDIYNMESLARLYEVLSFKVEPGSIVMTCFTSDFLLKDADEWRGECWKMIKSRSDCMFYFFTKRIERFMECVPADWSEGYNNVIVGCTCENQDRADFRLPIFTELPIKHKTVIIGPMLGPIELEKYLNGSICEVACSGESGLNVRPLDYDWVLDVRRQCMNKGVAFQFHQTGAYFIKDGRMYRVPRRFQTLQARKAGIDYKIVDGYMPDI